MVASEYVQILRWQWTPQLGQKIYPLPTVDKVFTVLAQGKSFSTIDLSRAWYFKQMEVAEESQLWLTINTHMGLFRYRRLPFLALPQPSNVAENCVCASQRLQGCGIIPIYL